MFIFAALGGSKIETFLKSVFFYNFFYPLYYCVFCNCKKLGMKYATDYMVNMGRKILEQNNYLFTINIDKLINEIDIINLKFLSVLWLANQCNLKAYKLSRIYKNDSGKSLKNYIFQVKMNRAIELLNIKNNLTINEVSKIIGYKNSEYFSKIFNEYYNKTPFEVKNSSKINSRIMQKFRGLQCRDYDLLTIKKLS